MKFIGNIGIGDEFRFSSSDGNISIFLDDGNYTIHMDNIVMENINGISFNDNCCYIFTHEEYIIKLFDLENHIVIIEKGEKDYDVNINLIKPVKYSNTLLNNIGYPLIDQFIFDYDEYNSIYTVNILGKINNYINTRSILETVVDKDIYVAMNKAIVISSNIINNPNKLALSSSYIYHDSELLEALSYNDESRKFVFSLVGGEDIYEFTIWDILNMDNVECIDDDTLIIIYDKNWDNAIGYIAGTEYTDMPQEDKDEILNILKGQIYNDITSSVVDLSIALKSDIDSVEENFIINKVDIIRDRIYELNNLDVIKKYVNICILQDNQLYRIDNTLRAMVKELVLNAEKLIQ